MLDVAFIGAGAIHFGGAEGPWDHSRRLERFSGVRFVGIVDPDTTKAGTVLEKKQNGPSGLMYTNCRVYPTLADLLTNTKPHCVFLGVPPLYHGSMQAGKDQELQLVTAGIHVFVEKPVSVIPGDKFLEYAAAVEAQRLKQNVILSVGYMFRYHAAVLKMRELISGHGGRVMALNARYYTAYSQMDHPFWWDINKSGGPIVEQATHFCDLARYLAGEIDLESVQSQCLRETDQGGAGKLSKVQDVCERDIAVDQRVPRVTMAMWRFQNGGLGSLTHAVALHGQNYETHIDVIMDGLRLTLQEPYTPHCKLLVRDGKTASDSEVCYNFGDDDPYERELDTFIRAAREGRQDLIASPYQDAAKTYDFTWAIRLAGEKGV